MHDRRTIDRQLVVDLGQERVLLFEHDVELLLEDLAVEEVLHAQPDARCLVGVGRADAALGRAELVLAQVPLGDAIEGLVIGQDQVRVGGHPQATAIDTTPGEHVDLGQQHRRIDHDAVADHGSDVVVQDPARYQLERELLAVRGDEGVAGVVAALIAHHDVHLLGEQVGEPTLPLIPPLGADHDGRGHESLLQAAVVTGRW